MERTISTLAFIALAAASLTAVAATPPPQPATRNNPPPAQNMAPATSTTNTPAGTMTAPVASTAAPQPQTSALPQPASSAMPQPMSRAEAMPMPGAMGNPQHMNAPKRPAMTVHKVRVPGDITYRGRRLALNGAGVHTTWWFFNKYVGALYLSNPTNTASEALSGNGAQAIWLSMLTNMKAKDFVNSLHKAFQNNLPNNNQSQQNGQAGNNQRQQNSQAMGNRSQQNGQGNGNQGAMQSKWQQFASFFTDLKKHDKVIIGYVPGEGTGVTINGQMKGTVPGEMFGRTVISMWIGGQPIDSGLKQKMLGKQSK